MHLVGVFIWRNMKYDIVEANSCEELKELVEDNLGRGWMLKGGIAVEDGVFYQAIGHASDGAGEAKTGDSSGEACGVCGKVGCTSKLHSDLEAMATMMKGFKR
jgi:hypothetical protein